MCCITRRFRLPRHEIAYVKVILEAYEGLAQMTSRAGRGEITWKIPWARRQEAEALYRRLKKELRMEELPQGAEP